MKIILTQEVKGKGGEGDVIDVARGYAVNYLFPRKMAIEATPGNLKQLQARLHNIQKREEGRVSDAQGVAARVEGSTIAIPAKVGEEGRLYGSVTSHMVGEAIAEQLGVDVDRRKIDMHGHIKTAGLHTVSVQVYRDVRATVNVNVVPEGTDTAEATAPVAAEAEEPAVVETAEEAADEAVASEETADEESEDERFEDLEA